MDTKIWLFSDITSKNWFSYWFSSLRYSTNRSSIEVILGLGELLRYLNIICRNWIEAQKWHVNMNYISMITPGYIPTTFLWIILILSHCEWHCGKGVECIVIPFHSTFCVLCSSLFFTTITSSCYQVKVFYCHQILLW